MRLEAEVAPEGMHDFDYSHPHIGMEIAQHSAHDLRGGSEQDFLE